VLAERDIMTIEQAERWARERREADQAFMDKPHHLRCRCGQSLLDTIVRACELGWVVSTRHRQVTLAECSRCSEPARRRLERAIAEHQKIN
jgi:hypothetical protein